MIFQTSYLNIKTVPIPCALTSWTRCTQRWELKLKNENWNSPKTSKNVTFAQFSGRPGKFLHRLQKINACNRCRIKNYTRNDSENVKILYVIRRSEQKPRNRKIKSWESDVVLYINRCVLPSWTTFVQGPIWKSQKIDVKSPKNLEKKWLLSGFKGSNNHNLPTSDQ